MILDDTKVPLIEESPIYSTKYIWSTQHYLQFVHINSDTYSVVSLLPQNVRYCEY